MQFQTVVVAKLFLVVGIALLRISSFEKLISRKRKRSPTRFFICNFISGTVTAAVQSSLPGSSETDVSGMDSAAVGPQPVLDGGSFGGMRFFDLIYFGGC